MFVSVLCLCLCLFVSVVSIINNLMNLIAYMKSASDVRRLSFATDAASLAVENDDEDFSDDDEDDFDAMSVSEEELNSFHAHARFVGVVIYYC